VAVVLPPLEKREELGAAVQLSPQSGPGLIGPGSAQFPLTTHVGGIIMVRIGILMDFACSRRSLLMSTYERLDIDQVGDVTVVRFRDHKIVEDVNIQQLGQEMFRLVETDHHDKLLLDFSSVGFLSSAALGKLITLDKKMKAHGGKLKLSNIRPEIYEVFAITKLNRLFDIRDDEADALAAF
jgi:anti-sigma B factor antagonist